ncbi:hypothetical protein [Thermococcus sp.]
MNSKILALFVVLFYFSAMFSAVTPDANVGLNITLGKHTNFTSSLPGEMGKIKSAVESLGVKVTKVSNGTTLWGYPEVSLSGTYTGPRGIKFDVSVSIIDYQNGSAASKNMAKLSCSPMVDYTILDDSAVLDRAGDGSSMCYLFYTRDIIYDIGKSTQHRAGPMFKYLEQHGYGRYIVSIGMSADIWYNGHFIFFTGNGYKEPAEGLVPCQGGVLCIPRESFTTDEAGNAVGLVLTFDDKAYAKYLNELRSMSGEIKGSSTALGNGISTKIAEILGVQGQETQTQNQTQKSTSRIRITMPEEGARLEPTVADIFVIPVWAEVKGNASYAVVTAPDGSKYRVDASGGFVADIVRMANPGDSGKISVQLYNGDGKVIASDSVSLNFWSEEKPGDGIDNDGDGLIDCDDPDIFTCDECVLEKQKEWADGIYKRHVDYLRKAIELEPGMESVYSIYLDDLKSIHEKYKDNPKEMVKRMNAYMEEKVYQHQKINTYLSIFKDDPEKRYQLRQIAIKYRYDPIMRDIKMRNFIYRNADKESTREAITNAILTGIIDPPKWLVGGQYGSGGALDWSQFVASNFEKVGDTIKLKGTAKVKMFTTPAGVFLVAQDAKALMDQARELQKMNLDDRTKVSIIVLDGATKIGKLLDPTGYFGNMADATISSLVNLRKKLEERNGGWFTWNGYVLHETEKPGIYEDYETGKKFKRVSGGWFGSDTFVEVK